MIAGFDGFYKNSSNYYDRKMFEDGRFDKYYDTLNKNTFLMLKKYASKLSPQNDIQFVTPSMYESAFKN